MEAREGGHLPNCPCNALQAHELIPQSGGQMLKIPMREVHVRSLNLSVSVGIGVYEAIRQLDGPVM